MSFDPTLPLENTETDAAQMRSQLNGLHDLILAVPAGPPGPPGDPGPQGPPFAAAVVDGVTTLPPLSGATVTSTFDGTTVHFEFGIPTGVPGEVSAAQLSDAVANALASALSNSSASTNGVAPLNLVVASPPTQAQMQALANKVDELILAMRRT